MLDHNGDDHGYDINANVGESYSDYLERMRIQKHNERHKKILQDQDLIKSARLKDAAKIIAGMENKKHIKNKLIKKMMVEGCNYAISRYFIKEAIPWNYSGIVKSKDCLEVLIKGFFYKVCKIQHSHLLNSKLGEFCETLRRNADNLIAYDRVALIQKFIHSTVDEKYEKDSHKNISKKHIKNLLSVSRLYFNLFDLNERNENYLIYMDDLSRAASNYEYVNPRTTELPTGKHFIPTWRVRHLKPLSYFYSLDKRSKFSQINMLDEQLPLNEFKQAALDIYARLDYQFV